VILTVDLGTSATKVVLWDDDGPGPPGRAEMVTVHPRPGWAEQDPAAWWDSVLSAASATRRRDPVGFAAVRALACSGARQTFAPVSEAGVPTGPGLVWSDRRAGSEAAELALALGGAAAVHARTGVPVDAEAVAAKVAWVARHQPAWLRQAAWLATPRDLVAWRLTGVRATDTTMAGRSGLYDVSGSVVAELAGPATGLLPAVVPPGSVLGSLRPGPAGELGLAAGIPVVLGAGDRACEVLGTGADGSSPMVSWGTTANVSRPLNTLPTPIPRGLVVSPGADGGWLAEGGLSAAGSLLAWWAGLTGSSPDALVARAIDRPPGARGVVVLPWLDGARAPWWRADVGAAVLGLSSAHDAVDVGRAVVEGVAREVAACLEALEPCGGAATSLTLGGAGTGLALWHSVLTAVTGLPARRRSGEAASAGAALLGFRALGERRSLDDLNPPVATVEPDPELVARYRELAPAAAATAAAVLGVGGPSMTAGPGGGR
jgi:sugar (pentulose or hexulose) kinase